MSLIHEHPDVLTAPVYITPGGRTLGVDERRGPRSAHDASRRYLVYDPRGLSPKRVFLLAAADAEQLSWIIAGLREPVYVPEKVTT